MTAVVVKFPYSVSRRAHARRPRKSKNGTPEQRAATELSQEQNELVALVGRHRAAWLAHAASGHAYGQIRHDSPEYEPAKAAGDADWKAYKEIAHELMSFVPTTVPAMVALLAYVDDFNHGGVTLPDGSWTSGPQEWPDDGDECDPDTYPWLLLRNVIGLLAVQS